MKSVIELIDPTNPITIHNHFKLGGGWSYVLDYSWIYNNITEYSKKNNINNILDVGCDKYVATALNINVIGIDKRNLPNVIKVENFLKFNPRTKLDVIFWASSLEHNGAMSMSYLFEHSMEILKPSGMFLATIPLSDNVYWNDISNHINLTSDVAEGMFKIDDTFGNYQDIREKYLSNPYNIMDKYEKRYGNKNLEYIIGGIRKINE